MAEWLYLAVLPLLSCLAAYYAFAAFGELYRRENQVDLAFYTDGVYTDGVYAVAARKDDGCLVIANTNEKEAALQLQLKDIQEIRKCMILSEGKIWCECALPELLPGYSVLCVYYDV